MAFQIVDVDARFEAGTPRDGMQLATLRLNDLRMPGHEDLGLHAQYAYQFGDGQNVDFDAQAFYVEPFYEFSTLPWTPTLAYRFAWFSGDADPDDGERRDFDRCSTTTRAAGGPGSRARSPASICCSTAIR